MNEDLTKSVIPFETMMSYLLPIATRYAKRFHYRYEPYEIANEVWSMGRIQKSINNKRLCMRIHWDIREVLRAWGGGKSKKKSKELINNPVHYDQLTLDDSHSLEFLSSKDTGHIEVDREDWFEDITRGCTDMETSILRLRFLEGYSQAEIARQLQYTQGGIHYLTIRALTKIRSRFALLDETYRDCLTNT